jgi:formylglycine-generating enzyme required for sulfatase activity
MNGLWKSRATLAAGAVAAAAILLLSPTSDAQQGQPAGRKLAFLVGVKSYDHADLKDLEFPENDVKELADVLQRQGFTVTLMSTSATRTDKEHFPDAKNIRQQLSATLKGVSKRDLILIALAGHGLQPLNASQSYFCPHNANPSERNGDVAHPETLLSIGEILAQIRDSGIGQKLLLVDACRNDPEVRGGRRGAGAIQVDISALPQQTGVLLSCARGEFSFESRSFGTGHGAFFFQVIEGLNGKAKDEDGDITWDSLRAFVKKRVPTSVRKIFGKEGGEQSPNEIGNLTGEPTLLARITVEQTPKDETEADRASRLATEQLKRANAERAASMRLRLGFEGSKAGQTRDDNGLKTKLVWIPPGDFRMGSPKDENGRSDDEGPVNVTLTKGFWLGQHEVTQAEWRHVMQATPWSGENYVKEGDDYPATYVSWNDATKFFEKLTETERDAGRLPEGWKYTLPTEAQWEYACRGGSKSRFSFGDDESDLGDYGWFRKNADDAGEKYAHLVGQKKANPLGLFDMHGNVWEWCRDVYAEKLPGGDDPEVSAGGSDRVARGGSWYGTAGGCRSAWRRRITPDDRIDDLGFRVALTPSAK